MSHDDRRSQEDDRVKEFPYDVFLSYSAKHKAVVCAVAERLRVDGVTRLRGFGHLKIVVPANRSRHRKSLHYGGSWGGRLGAVIFGGGGSGVERVRLTSRPSVVGRGTSSICIAPSFSRTGRGVRPGARSRRRNGVGLPSRPFGWVCGGSPTKNQSLTPRKIFSEGRIREVGLKRPHSKRFARFVVSRATRQRLECGRFSVAFPTA